MSIGRQEMYLPFLLNGIVTNGFEVFHRGRMLYAHLRRQVFYAVNRPIPHDVVNVDVVANECVGVVVDVDYSNKSIALYAEIVEERRVLTEWIVSIVGKIAW